MSLNRGGSRWGAESPFYEFSRPGGRPTGGRAELQVATGWLCICPLSLLIGRSSERPAAVQGARIVRGGGKIFSGFEKIFRSAPLRARTVLEHGDEGKGGWRCFIGPPCPRAFDFRLTWADGGSPTNGRRKRAAVHAVCLPFTLPNSLRLARCMANAASVSDWRWAKRSSSTRVMPGRRKLSQRGSSRNNSQGVAQRW